MAAPDIETVWRRIRRHTGETFYQMRGGAFSYSVAGGCVYPDRTQQQIPKSHFSKALELVPAKNTAPFQHLRGPSFIYAILMDPRIRAADW